MKKMEPGKKIKITFLILVFFQTIHSAEEYFGKLWESFPPARFACGLVSDNPETGFLILNIGIFVIGLIVWIIITFINFHPFYKIVWFWIHLELINGIAHTIWSFSRDDYEPGVLTAPILFIIVIYIWNLLSKLERSP
jgi:hypothetical protein